MSTFPADNYVDAQKKWIGKRCIVTPSVRNVLDDCRMIQNKRILDVGCGSGHYSKSFVEWGAKCVVGIDSSSDMIKQCESSYHDDDRLRFFNTSAEEFAFEEKFDIIVAFYVLQFIHNPEKLQTALNHIYQSLELNGVFVAAVPNGCPEFNPIPEEGKKFGAAVESPQGQVQDGQVLKINFYENNEVVGHSEVIIRFRETYEKMLLSAGFSKVEFVFPVISKEGTHEYGADFFASYMTPPKDIFLRAYKQ